MSSASRSRAVLVALRTWLLPVALGAGAFGLHYALHVPAGPLPPPSPAQLEEAKKQADKEKREAERKQKEEDRKAGKRPAVERSSVRDLPYEAFTRPRSEFILAQLREYYIPLAFKTEPTFEAWQTATKSHIGQLVSAARQLALPAGPNITVASSECHTIRCRFTLSSPDSASLATVVEILQTLELDGQSIWFLFKPGKVVEEPSKREGVEARHKQELVVIYQRDIPPVDRIESPGKGRLRPAAPPVIAPQTGTGMPGSTGVIPGVGKPGKPVMPGSTAKPSPTGAVAPEPDPTPK
jgi:hypothetical protein